MNRASELAALAAAGSLRRRRIAGSPCGPHMRVDGKPLLSFASNDYLGLAAEPQLIEAACSGARQWGVGAGASHYLGGHFETHEAAELALAAFVGGQRALLFSTGYMANLGIIPALVGRGDAVFADKLNHASLIDGVKLSMATHHRYPHLDITTLTRLLAGSRARRKLILTDAVFSMDGDIAPLPQLLELAEKVDAWLVVDDAHGFGLMGPQGRGTMAHFGLTPSHRLLIMGTLGKAAGLAGAFVAGDKRAIEWLEQKARTAIYTTAAPPLLSVALLASLQMIAAADDRREHLRQMIAKLRADIAPICARTGWWQTSSPTAIQPVVIGDNARTLAVGDGLLAKAIWAPAIRPPTVPPGQARLRISLSAAHTEADLNRLTGALLEIAG
jgi:8-amino-7-oxononanoate synthase